LLLAFASGVIAASREAPGLVQLLEDTGIHGGAIVHVGCGAGEQTAALARGGSLLVQGLGRDRTKIGQARQLAQSLGLAGRVTFRTWQGGRLPYTDNLVNVLFWQRSAGEADEAEILRVLAPRGVAFNEDGGQWRKLVKPWPDEIDEWPHFRYDAGNKGASNDTRAGPPRHVQWEAGPRVMRSHEIDTGLSGLVSANGRIYYLLDEGPIGITDARFPPKWSLVCRDAFNGVLLWKRPLPEWGWQAWSKKSRVNDPNVWLGTRTRGGDVDRRFVAHGDALYVTLGFGAPISRIDGATGDVVQTYAETAGAAEFIFLDGLLLVWTAEPKHAVTAIRASDGTVAWRHNDGLVVDRSLCATGGRVFFHNRSELVALDLHTGDLLWRQETQLRPAGVIAHDDAVLVVQNKVTLAYSPADGAVLWKGPGVGSRGRYPDLFVVGDLAWWGRPQFSARNLKTGEIVETLDLQKVLESGHHRRCYTDRATACFMITGERGSEFLDLQEGNHSRHNWIRGPCVSGMVPANGLFYVPPHQCFCYPAVKLDGFFAVSSELENPPDLSVDGPTARLEKGPAYSDAAEGGAAEEASWPTYRQNVLRGGASAADVPADLDRLWSVELGGNLTQPVVAGGKVFVAQKDACTIHCLDFGTGKLLWSRTVAGPVDSPPTIHRGLVLFGSRDGFVYSLRAADGQLAWRFRAAPEDRQIVSYDRLESAWPVHGSVLVMNGLVYCTAGRSGFLDGGIHLYAIDPATGEVVHQQKLAGPDPDISEPSFAFHEEGHRADLLTSDGRYIYMGRTVLDDTLAVVEPERIAMIGAQRGDEMEYRKMPGMRLVATGGLLNDTFWNRTWWMYSYVWPSFLYAQQAPKSGQMLVFDDDATYTVKHYTTRNRHSPMLFPGSGYLLFADANDNEPLLYRGEGEPKPIEWEPVLPPETRWTIFQDAAVDKGPGFTRAEPTLWTTWVDVRIEAMVLAGEKLFFAGPPDVVPEDDPLAALEGRMGGILRGVSTKDGSPLAEYPLDAKPVFDGLIAAEGRLIVSLKDGRVMCMGGR
jgi:outer membrane protein assembly factor BamB